MKTKALPREDRKRQIMMAFAAEIQEGNSGEMTLADIAHWMHQSPSTKLRDMVTELVIEGVIDYRTEPKPGVTGFRRIYSPNPENFKRPTPRYIGEGRPIKINARQGSFIAMLEVK